MQVCSGLASTYTSPELLSVTRRVLNKAEPRRNREGGT